MFEIENCIVIVTWSLKLGHIAHIIKSDIVAQTAVNGTPVGQNCACVVQNICNESHLFTGKVFAAGVIITLNNFTVLFNTELEPDAAVTGKNLFTGQMSIQL